LGGWVGGGWVGLGERTRERVCACASRIVLRRPPHNALSDGWLQYTAINISASGAPDASTGFDAFTNVMSVPDVPRRPAQVGALPSHPHA
jgi:hypothetical protein